MSPSGHFPVPFLRVIFGSHFLGPENHTPTDHKITCLGRRCAFVVKTQCLGGGRDFPVHQKSGTTKSNVLLFFGFISWDHKIACLGLRFGFAVKTQCLGAGRDFFGPLKKWDHKITRFVAFWIHFVGPQNHTSGS